MKNYLTPLLLILFIIFSTGVKAQLNYKKGFIISLENDTVYGFINDGGGLKNSKVCLFKPERKSKAMRYYPKDIKSFRMIGDKNYCSKELFINDEFVYVFTEVLLEGKLDLYYHRENRELEFYLQRDTSFIGLLDKKVILPVSADGLYGLVNSERYIPLASEEFHNQTNSTIYVDVYKDTLYTIFSDCKIVTDQIENLDYNQKSLTAITKAYINETCQGSDCISYEKDYNLSRPHFGIFSGVQFSKIIWAPNLTSETYMNYPIGLFYNIPLSLINDRLSFQIELIYKNMDHAQTYNTLYDSIRYMHLKSNSIGIPLLLKYEITRKRVSPSVAIGKESVFDLNSYVKIDYDDELLIHKSQKGGWFYEFGLNYKLSPGFSLFSNLRLQTKQNLIVPTRSKNSTSYSETIKYELFVLKYKTNIITLHLGMRF